MLQLIDILVKICSKEVIKISDIGTVVVFRFVIIVVCSLLIGLNRGMMNQFAGVKTHLFVGIGAGLSFLIPYVYYVDNPNLTADPFRLSAQVISGIGFLGAGTIIKSGQSIRGLTTAAGLWATAIIAITIATGEYVLSFSAMGFVLLFLIFGNKIDISRRYSTRSFIITLTGMENNLKKLDEFMKDNSTLQGDCVILEYLRNDEQTIAMVKYDIVYRQCGLSTNDIIEKMAKFDFIEKIDLQTELQKI